MAVSERYEVVHRGLEQLSELICGVDRVALQCRTPCEQWTVQDLIRHIVAAPTRFAAITRGEVIDWSAATPPSGDDPATVFRSHAEDLLRALEQHQPLPGPATLDWQCAELAVHTWDLSTALGKSTAGLDPEVADRGLAFMRANLTPDRRSPAFGPEQSAPADGDAYQRIAAFAGRSV
jgi:uncharacterized protein (TIGR03086 family)